MNILFIPNKGPGYKKPLFHQGAFVPFDACIHYRLYLPWKFIKAPAKMTNSFKVPINWITLPDGSQKPAGYKILSPELNWADVVVFARFYDNVGITGLIASWCKQNGKTIIYEADDNYILLDQIKYQDGMVARAKLGMKFVDWIMQNADAITVSTDYLKMGFAKHTTRPIYVLPNSIDPAEWKRKKIKNKKIRIGWAGSKSHQQDLEILKKPLEQIKAEYKDGIEIVFLSNLGGLSMPFKFEHHQAVLMKDYSEKLQSLNLDIGLAPLKAIDFNRCRSNIKWIEYSMAGAATIASDMEPYKDIIGILSKNTPTGWYNSLKNLIDNTKKRKALSEDARQKVLDDFNIKKNANLWLKVYDEVKNKNNSK